MSSVLCLSPSLTGAIHHHHRFQACCSSPETLNHLNSSSPSSSSSSCSQIDAPQLKRALAREENQNHHHHLKADGSPNGGSNKLMRMMMLQRHRGLGVLEEEDGESRKTEGGFDDPDSSQGLAKRRRPARLFIPPPAEVVSVSSPLGRIDGPKEVAFEGDGYSVYCRKGRRRVMEDSYTAVVDDYSHRNPKQKFFGIFDGHGGKSAAEFASNNLGANIMNQAVTCMEDDEMKEAVRNGYLKTDADFLKQQTSGGTCCVTAWFRNSSLVVSNAGDCRAVLSREGCAEALTVDHRPCLEDERQRIEDLGGYVDFFHGAWRVQGTLAVSRGIGDCHLKTWVPAEPDTKILRTAPEHEFLIMATDGLWDKVTNQEAVDLARPLCTENADPSSVISACKMLAELSVRRGSVDDISVMIIQLQQIMISTR